MSEAAVFSLAEFQAELESARRKPAQSDTRWFPPLAWLGLAPAWPAEFAIAGFPIDEKGETATGDTVLETLRELESMGRLISGAGEPPPEGTWFWLDRRQRATTFGEILRSPNHGLDFLYLQLSAAASAMQRAAGATPLLNPTLERWLRLATVGGPERMAELIDGEIAAAITAATEAQSGSCPAAARWVYTAEPLAEVFGGHVEVAVARARRRLEQFRRNARDQRQLQNYYPRPGLEAAVGALVAETADQSWALHYVGGGGSGKTMLVQHIRTAMAQEFGLAIGHIDFDSLNPDYPRRAPGLMLMGFAEDLRLQDDPAVAEIFYQFDRAIRVSHEKLSGAALSGIRNTADEVPDFAVARGHFIEAVRTIYQRQSRRPVLILDTCEELARIRADGHLPENVDFTFKLLEGIQSEVPALRVIFAGRRALARRGFGWDWRQCRLPERNYLRLEEVLLFSDEEARGFLAQYTDRDSPTAPERRVPEASYDDILRLCRQQEDDRDPIGFAISWKDGRGPPSRPRYNPYDIDLLARWASSPDGLDVRQLAGSGMHFFIKERVVGRINLDVRSFLPDLALLGRFDRSMIGDLTGYSGEFFENFWDYLVLLEWVSVDRNAQLDQVWVLDPHYRRRLLAYYHDEEDDKLEVARDRVWMLLNQITLERPFSALSPADFVACLTTAPRDGKAAAIWWHKVEERIATTGEWAWGRQLTDAVLADDEACARVEGPDGIWSLRGAVRATAIAADLHGGREIEPSAWNAVAVDAELHPRASYSEGGFLPDLRERLLLRAQFGRLAARLRGAASVDYAQFEQLLSPMTDLGYSRKLVDHQLQAAAVAMIEAAVEWAEGAEEPKLWYDVLSKLQPIVTTYFTNDNLRAFLRSLFARVAAVATRDRDRALAMHDEAIALAGTDASGQHWLDWRAPDDLEARLRLERARLAAPRARVRASADTIDGERLKAAELVWDLRQYGISGLDKPGTYEVVVAEFAPSCNAHRAFPPLFAVSIEGNAARGDIEGAVREALAISGNTKLRLDLRQAADRALLNFAIWLLLFEEKVGLETTLTTSGIPRDQAMTTLVRMLARSERKLSEADAQDLVNLFDVREFGGREEGARERGLRQFVTGLVLGRLPEFSLPVERWGIDRDAAPASLFAEARKDFEAAHDSFGVSLCHVAEALHQPHDRQRLRAAVAAALNNPFYSAIDTRRMSTDASAEEWLAFVEGLPSLWRPWTVRLAACAIRAQEFARSGERTRYFGYWLRTHYGGATPHDLNEFIGASPKRLQLAAQALIPYRRFLDIGLGLVGVTFIIGIAVLLYHGYSLVLDWLGIVWATSLRGGTFVALLAGLGYMPRLMRVFPGWLNWLLQPHIRITSDVPARIGSAVNLNKPSDDAFTVSPALRFGLPLLPAGVAGLRAPAAYSGMSYGEQAGTLTLGTRSAVLMLRAVTAARCNLMIELDEAAAGEPWEAVFGQPGWARPTRPFVRFQRRPLERAVSAATEAAAGARVVTLYGDISAVRFSVQAWAALENAKLTHALESPPPAGQMPREPDVAVLHILGYASETAGGLRVQLNRTEDDPATSIELRADQIAGAFPGLRLCIVQDFPEEPRPRTSSDRLVANIARGFGYQLQRVGISAVIMLPRLPLSLATEAIAVLAGVIAARPRDGVAALGEALVSIRARIARDGHPDAESASEIAFDLCFYAADKVDLRSLAVVQATAPTSGNDAVSVTTA